MVAASTKIVYDARGNFDSAAWGMMFAWLGADVSVKEIARRLNVSPGTIRYQRAFTSSPSTRTKRVPRKALTAAKRAIETRRRRVKVLLTTIDKTVRVEQRARSVVKSTLVKFPFGSPRRVARQLTLEGIKVSPTTVRRDAKACGLTAAVRPRRPRQESDDTERRITFAKRLLKLPKSRFEHVYFTDEKWFDSDDHGNRFQYVVARRGQRVYPRSTSQYPKKCHIWGCIGKGLRLLVVHVAPNEEPGAKLFGPGRPRKGEVRPSKEQRDKAKRCLVSAPVYIKKCLVPMFPKKLPVGNQVLFMQDGAACHTAKVTLDWLKARRVEVMGGWPARSPDLNPIEHLWALLQQRVSDHGPLTVEELRKFVKEEWGKLDQSMIDRYVESFRGRLRRVVEAKGAYV